MPICLFPVFLFWDYNGVTFGLIYGSTGPELRDINL
jgi:hypothetical protein